MSSLFEAYERGGERNAFFRIGAAQGQPGDVRQHYALDKRLQDLYQEQREERTQLWRDLSRLRLAFPETAQSYLAASRKLSLLENEWGDAS